jgi:hypothetical protein
MVCKAFGLHHIDRSSSGKAFGLRHINRSSSGKAFGLRHINRSSSGYLARSDGLLHTDRSSNGFLTKLPTQAFKEHPKLSPLTAALKDHPKLSHFTSTKVPTAAKRERPGPPACIDEGPEAKRFDVATKADDADVP